MTTQLDTPAQNGMKIPTKRQSLIAKGSVVALLVLVLALGFAAGLGYSQVSGAITHSDTGSKAMVLNVTVVQIDNGADATEYANARVGSVIRIKLFASNVTSLLDDSADKTICSPDGLAISGHVTQQNTAASPCGPSIHVVVIPPL